MMPAECRLHQRASRHVHLAVWLALFLALFLAACGQNSTSGAAGTQSSVPPATTAEAQTTAVAPTDTQPGAPAATVAGGAGNDTYQNPVLRADFADPAVLKVGETYYAYATNAIGKNIQVAQSNDLVTWKQLPDAMPALAKWAKPGGSLVWAPEVIQVGEQFLLYYTARDKTSDKQCIGVATSAKPEGKFRDTNDAPFVCQADQGGSIDPSPFRDGDKLYLYWKNDGNCCAKPTYLYVQELAANGLSLVGEPTQLVRNDAAWEGNLVEAPTMVKRENRYYLFFSANDYGGPKYAVGYATCETVTGPCQDAPENPILKSQMQQKPLVIGPGHQTVVQVNEQMWIIYHAWEVTSAGLRGNRRFMYLDKIEWKDGKPVINGPTTSPQPDPLD